MAWGTARGSVERQLLPPVNQATKQATAAGSSLFPHPPRTKREEVNTTRTTRTTLLTALPGT